MTGTRVASAGEISPTEPKRVVVDGIPVVLARDTAGDIHALGDRCTHGDVSLAEGFIEGDSIECWAHGSCFSMHTGKPANLPAYEPVPVYPVTIEGDDVFVDVHHPFDPATLTEKEDA